MSAIILVILCLLTVSFITYLWIQKNWSNYNAPIEVGIAIMDFTISWLILLLIVMAFSAAINHTA